MAETAQDTPAPKTMHQAFEAAVKDLRSEAVASSEEQVAEPVSESSEREEAPEGETKPVAETKDSSKPNEEKAAGMRAADYTQKTQELARMRTELKGQVDFAEAWMPTAVAYNKASPEVQAQIKSLLEGKPAPAKAGGGRAAGSERVQKLLETFEEGDRGAVKDIFEVMLEEAEAIASKKYGELDRKINDRSAELAQESEIRQEREAREAFSEFDRACPEWRELSERQLAWFQNEIVADPSLDPVKHFKETFLPELGSRGKKESSETVTKIIGRAGQTTLRPNNAAAKPVEEKPKTLRDALEATMRKMGG